jgi:hypothetical protein
MFPGRSRKIHHYILDKNEGKPYNCSADPLFMSSMTAALSRSNKKKSMGANRPVPITNAPETHRKDPREKIPWEKAATIIIKRTLFDNITRETMNIWPFGV